MYIVQCSVEWQNIQFFGNSGTALRGVKHVKKKKETQTWSLHFSFIYVLSTKDTQWNKMKTWLFVLQSQILRLIKDQGYENYSYVI